MVAGNARRLDRQNFLDSQGVTSLEFIPVTIDDYSQPRLAEGIEKDVILKGLRFELVEGKVLVK